MKQVVFILSVVGLSACQPAFIDGAPNENSPYFSVPVDSKLVLRNAVTVPAGDDSLFFQDGRTMPWSAINMYRAACWIKLRVKHDMPLTIAPDTFTIGDVHTEQRFRLGYAPRTQLATIDTDDSDNTYQVLATVMKLNSERQSDVSEIVCVDWQQPQGLYSITVRKMRSALGRWFDLTLAPLPR